MIQLDSEYEWDEPKNWANFEKHGIDFNEARQIFSGPIKLKDYLRRDYGEPRTIAYGLLEGRVIAVVYTWRDNKRRIISARRARRDERRDYYQP